MVRILFPAYSTKGVILAKNKVMLLTSLVCPGTQVYCTTYSGRRGSSPRSIIGPLKRYSCLSSRRVFFFSLPFPPLRSPAAFTPQTSMALIRYMFFHCLHLSRYCSTLSVPEQIPTPGLLAEADGERHQLAADGLYSSRLSLVSSIHLSAPFTLN